MIRLKWLVPILMALRVQVISGHIEKEQCGVATSVGGDSTVHQEQVIWSATGAAKATLCFFNSILAVDFP
jgi:hypothetical protein